METAVNPPIAYPELATGSLLYGLAHEALKSDSYKDFLKNHNRYLILDNGADELGSGIGGNELYQLILETDPSEIILPDVLGDPDSTKINSEAFYKGFLQGNENLGHINIMAVAQGMTHLQFIDCYKHWLECDYVDVIGIPYDIEFDSVHHGATARELLHKSVRRGIRRLELVEQLHKRGLVGKPLHLLGWNTQWEITQYKSQKYRWVRSNDTTAPLAAALQRIRFSNQGYKDWAPMDFDAEMTGEQYDYAIDNLLLYYKAAGDVDGILNLGMLIGKTRND